MQTFTKGSTVKRILDHRYPQLEGYLLLNDSWITENDKILFNKENEKFNVLDFMIFKENTLIMDTVPFESGWREYKFSCVKLDKIINVGDILYTVKK